MTRTEEFDYHLPPTAIAQTPVEPRDSARLLDTRNLTDHRVADLPRLLHPGDVVVVNRTRVRPARLRGEKTATGGKVEALLLRRLDDERWEALVRPARRVRVGTCLRFGSITAEVVAGPEQGRVTLVVKAPEEIERAVAREGEIPLPPYIDRPLADPDRYQTVFADRTGSAAAPTAGLHFTPDLVRRLAGAGIALASVDLEVGLGTFQPIATETIEDHRLHIETYRVDEKAAEAVAGCRRAGGRVVAVGTTTLRALETCVTEQGLVEPGEGETDLYLRPGSRFGVVDGLLTNFHLPRSSLVVLVAAFMGEGWRRAYAAALDRGYRFLSFGDAMYCERAS